jgi:hypothetical protein
MEGRPAIVRKSESFMNDKTPTETSGCFLYKIKKKTQTVRMEKIKIFDGDGKSRDERETCFPKIDKKWGMMGDGTR